MMDGNFNFIQICLRCCWRRMILNRNNLPTVQETILNGKCFICKKFPLIFLRQEQRHREMKTETFLRKFFLRPRQNNNRMQWKKMTGNIGGIMSLAVSVPVGERGSPISQVSVAVCLGHTVHCPPRPWKSKRSVSRPNSGVAQRAFPSPTSFGPRTAMTGSVTEPPTRTVLGLKPNITTGPTEEMHLKWRGIELLC